MKRFIDSIGFARAYTVDLLDTIPQADWFRMPSEGVTHVAWQVGHLAMAQYRLTMERLRGPRPEDEDLISTAFLKLFGRESLPVGDPKAYPPPEEIRAVFDRVHNRALSELGRTLESELTAACLVPHRLVTTKGGCLMWCSHHEMLHAGQIGLLRRLLGAKPVW